MGFGAVVVVCGRDHLPVGVLAPIANNTEVVPRLHDQISAAKPIRKNLWKQIVMAKVRAQAENLDVLNPGTRRLLLLTQQVRSGDPANIEAQAAKVYWGAWLGGGVKFKRDIDGDGINAMLNYGYAVLRAGMARAIVSGGLQPAIGLYHHNRSNAFCLADDLMEPLRPMVDSVVRELVRRCRTDIGQDEKKALLGVLHRTVAMEDQTGPLMVAMHQYVASYCRCLGGESKRLTIPVTHEGETVEEAGV
jgi:CRISPR-associated protein Cas1